LLLNQLIENNNSIEELERLIISDPEISLLNNQEPAIVYFEEESFSFLPFDDLNFYDYLFEAPLGDYSSVHTLYTKNPGSEQKEDYAFLVFYLKKKQSGNLPINYLIKKLIDEKNYL